MHAKKIQRQKKNTASKKIYIKIQAIQIFAFFEPIFDQNWGHPRSKEAPKWSFQIEVNLL